MVIISRCRSVARRECRSLEILRGGNSLFLRLLEGIAIHETISMCRQTHVHKWINPVQHAGSKRFALSNIFAVTMTIFVSGAARGGVFVPRHSTRRERPYRDIGDSRECEDARCFRNGGHRFPGKRSLLYSRRHCFGPLFFVCAACCCRFVVSCRDFCALTDTCFGPFFLAFAAGSCCFVVSCGERG